MQNFNRYKGFIVYRDGADLLVDADIGVEIVMRKNDDGGFACTARHSDFAFSERKFGIPVALVEELSENAMCIAALVLADMHLKSARAQERDFLKAVFEAQAPDDYESEIDAVLSGEVY